jgi:disulfide bond formation protein DsbB|tara:strand:- start:494 stop:970 length:477 start_codon:yes stop_codon:yes gene_type:complete
MFIKIENLFYPLIMLISIFAILSALYIEHILSIQACKLCLYQRIPFIFSIIVCFFGFFFRNNKILIYLLIIIFLINLILSGYHLGIENNIFSEFSGCTNQSLNIIDKSKLLENLNSFLPNCKDVNFRIFGLSLAAINFFLSIALSVISIKYYYYEKNR